MKHIVKIEPKYAERIITGEKTFEVRLNDRDYQKGDTLIMQPIYRVGDTHKYDWVSAEIAYIHSGYGLEENFVVLALKNVCYQERES